ncbi:hypothetical protein MED222_06895 [Vibrio sp. MED222]|nr:hypothetical protein MED222_06895 [Vibrio sp. MED222]
MFAVDIKELIPKRVLTDNYLAISISQNKKYESMD